MNIEIRDEIIKRIEEHKQKVKKSVLLNSHEYNIDEAVKDAVMPYDICIDIINQMMNSNEFKEETIYDDFEPCFRFFRD